MSYHVYIYISTPQSNRVSTSIRTHNSTNHVNVVCVWSPIKGGEKEQRKTKEVNEKTTTKWNQIKHIYNAG